MHDPEFSLIDDPWVPVRSHDGVVTEVSLRDLIIQAPQLERIVCDLPTQSFAVLRLGLAFIARAVAGPPSEHEWGALHDGGPPAQQIDTYADQVRGRFWLFHPTAPFFQVAGLHTSKNEMSGLEKLVADVPAGHPYFTMRIGPGMQRLTAAEAARWLVHLQAFDASGIKSGAVGDPRVKGGKGYPIGTGWAGALGGVFVEGTSLWETFLLNLIPTGNVFNEADHRDRPAWEAEPPGPEEAPNLPERPYGPLDLYTWQSRRVLLQGDASGVTAVLVANGDKLAPPYRWAREPMTAWRRSIPQEKKLKLGPGKHVYMPLEHRPERAFWRGIGATLPASAPQSRSSQGADRLTSAVYAWAGEALGEGRSLRLRAIGMAYGTQNATVTEVYEDYLELPAHLLSSDSTAIVAGIRTAIEDTEQGVLALRDLAANLSRAGGSTDSKLVDGARDRASEAAYAALEGPFRAWVAGLTPEMNTATSADEARIEWYATAHRIINEIGSDLVHRAGSTAWVGRVVGGTRITAPLAHLWFRAKLAKVLPRPASTGPDEQENTHDGD